MKLNQFSHSVLEAVELGAVEANMSRGEIKKDSFHWITKPAKAILRVAVIGVVTLTVSPFGAVFNGVLAASHLFHYSVKKYMQGEALQSEKWDKITKYATASFTDFSCFSIGAAVTGVMIVIGYSISLTGTLKGTALKIANCTVVPAMGAAALHFLGAYYPSEYLARLLGDSESKTAMYLSLEMRNQFGLVAENGGLLKFSNDDEIKYTKLRNGNVNFHGNACKRLKNIIEDAEYDLLDLVKEVDSWMYDNELPPIEFQYPFNGLAVAKNLENALKGEKNPSQEILDVLDGLKAVDYDIKNLRDIYYNSLDIALKDSIGIEILSRNKKTIEIKKEVSFIDAEDYESVWDYCGSEDSDVSERPSLHQFYHQLKVGSQEPQDSEPADVYEKFLYRLAVSKWQVENGQAPMELHVLVGLSADFTEDEMNMAFRPFKFALHPDKNKHRETEAHQLYMAFGEIVDQFKQRFI